MEPDGGFEKFIKTVGANLRNARLANGWEIETAASDIGMPPERLELIENGQVNWEVREIEALSSFYKIPVSTLGTPPKTNRRSKK